MYKDDLKILISEFLPEDFKCEIDEGRFSGRYTCVSVRDKNIFCVFSKDDMGLYEITDKYDNVYHTFDFNIFKEMALLEITGNIKKIESKARSINTMINIELAGGHFIRLENKGYGNEAYYVFQNNLYVGYFTFEEVIEKFGIII